MKALDMQISLAHLRVPAFPARENLKSHQTSDLSSKVPLQLPTVVDSKLNY